MDSLGLCFNKLPKHVVETMIVDKLSLPDLIRFGAICHSGRSMAAQSQLLMHPLPLLMISRDKETQIGSFFSLSDSKIYQIKLQKEASESFCSGSSSEGYLIMANMNGNFLYNPFNRNTISLPPQFIPPYEFRKKIIKRDCPSYLSKAVLCTSIPNTSSSSPYILALGSNARVIEICKPHYTEWSIFGADMEDYESESEDEDELINRYWKQEQNRINLPEEYVDNNEEYKRLFADLLIYKGMLYGLTHAITLVCFQLHHSSNSLVPKELNMHPKGKFIKKGIHYGNYLVESGEELLWVHRIRSFDRDGIKFSTIKFSVYRLKQTNDFFEWVEVQSLGNQMLFLGRNTSISVSTNGIPGLKGNCIYFIDDMWPFFDFGINSVPSCVDNGVFYLDDGHIEKFYTPSDSDLIKSQPFWITPHAIQDVNS